jgi:hypothetical protein
MNHENSITGGANPRRTLTKLKTNVQTKRTVARIVPISASNAAFLSVMVGVCALLLSGATCYLFRSANSYDGLCLHRPGPEVKRP